MKYCFHAYVKKRMNKGIKTEWLKATIWQGLNRLSKNMEGGYLSAGTGISIDVLFVIVAKNIGRNSVQNVGLKWSRTMNGEDELQKNYDDLINRIFEITYEDLIFFYRKKRSAAQRVMYANTEAKRNGALNDLKNAIVKIEWLSNWLRDVLPQWRDIDADNIIKRAKEVAYVGDTEQADA